MERIKLEDNDFTQLTTEQVQGLFGCTSPESRSDLAGLAISIRPVPGADRGFFEVEVTDGVSSYTHNTTLGDDQIEKWIAPDDLEDEFDGLPTHEEYRRDHEPGYFLWSRE